MRRSNKFNCILGSGHAILLIIINKYPRNSRYQLLYTLFQPQNRTDRSLMVLWADSPLLQPWLFFLWQGLPILSLHLQQTLCFLQQYSLSIYLNDHSRYLLFMAWTSKHINGLFASNNYNNADKIILWLGFFVCSRYVLLNLN